MADKDIVIMQRNSASTFGQVTVAGASNVKTALGTDSAGVLVAIASVAGSELVTNGTFTSDLTDWSGANWAHSSGKALHSAGAATALRQAGTAAVVGTRYVITYTISDRTAGSVQVYFGGVWGGVRSTNATFTDYVTATATDALEFQPTSSFDGAVDTVSVKPLTEGEIVSGPQDVRGPLTVRGGILIPDGQHIAIGYGALANSSQGTYGNPSSNIAIGWMAGNANSTGHVTVVGHSAGMSNTGDGNLTAVGRWAGRANTTGHGTFFGNAAGRSNTTSHSTIVGDEAGGENQTGSIAALGYYALSKLLNVHGTAIGHEAGRFATNADGLTLGGYQAGYVNNGAGTTAFGHEAAWGYNGVDFTVNPSILTAFGYRALKAATATGSTAVGYLALPVNTTGLSTAVGYAAGANNTTGNLTVLGYGAGNAATTGNSTAVGHNAGAFTTTGDITAVGYEAGLNAVSANLTAVGHTAARAATASGTTAIGYTAGLAVTSGVITAIGHDAVKTATTTTGATGVGWSALRQTTTGQSTGVGYGAGIVNTTGHLTAVGYQSGAATTTGSATFLGHNTGLSNTTGDIIAIGRGAGWGVTTTNSPATDTGGILIGNDANRSVVTASQLTNYVGIGDAVLIDKSHQVKLGNDSITETVLQGRVVIADSPAPAAANSTGVAGSVAWADGFIYVCIATDTWQRAAIATW